ncbi:MAG: hypothetical protein Q9M36_15100 [Sulfurovum sp.]|nr:hypothetical protein [Sulfurovum sp.]
MNHVIVMCCFIKYNDIVNSCEFASMAHAIPPGPAPTIAMSTILSAISISLFLLESYHK